MFSDIILKRNMHDFCLIFQKRLHEGLGNMSMRYKNVTYGRIPLQYL